MSYEENQHPPEVEAERVPADVDLTAIYLREVGSTPLLDREQEVDLASRIQQARKDFAAAAFKLPAACRSQVIEPGLKARSKKVWTMQQIESCRTALDSYLEGDPTLKTNADYRALLEAKRRLGRSRDAMIEANLRLVAHVAKKFCNQGMSFMDLVQEGNIGLMKAVEKFEHERGYKFSTYAFWWIKQAITRAIADKTRTIRIPVHLLEKVRKVQRASRELEKELGREPNATEIATKIQVPVRAVVDILGSTAEG